MRGLARLLALCVAVSLIWGAAPASAQDTPSVIRSPVLSINFDQFRAQSQLGKQLEAEFEADRILIEAENRRIEAELEAEEQKLTEERATMPSAEFREAAKAFDEKVEKIRAERRAASASLTQRRDELRARFDAFALPVLTDIVREAGAAVVVDTRTVVVSIDLIDITDLAIARMDAALRAQDPDEKPEPQPTPEQ